MKSIKFAVLALVSALALTTGSAQARCGGCLSLCGAPSFNACVRQFESGDLDHDACCPKFEKALNRGHDRRVPMGAAEECGLVGSESMDLEAEEEPAVY